jgi:NADPH2:quinone reductase
MAARELPKPVDVVKLNRYSQGVLGFWLAHCFAKPGMFSEPVAEMLGMVARGELSTITGGTYALGDARRAHEDLRSRKTVGKLVLDPSAS